tara:strand:- start:2402 stop:3853 length:1452 start_codon:yes stop_codon:yes gene_type:complete
MISVSIDDIEEGMVLAEDVAHNASVIMTRDTVLKSSHVESLRKFNITDVLVRDIEGEKIADEKIKSAHKSMAGLGKRMFRKGEFVCVQGESSEELYIMLDGELNVIFTDPEHFTSGMDSVDKIPIIEKHGKIVTVIKGRMINFGELGALLGERRTATIVTKIDSVIARIPIARDGFNKTILKNPKLGINIAITIAKRLKDINVYIAKYNSVLSQVDSMIREFSTIYVTIAGKVLKHAIATKDKNLEIIHDQFKVSPLYNRLLKYKKQSISSQTLEAANSEEISEDSEIFKHGNLINKKPGEIICYQGEVGDKMYILVSGKLGVFVGDKIVACYNTRGEVIGETSVLLGYASAVEGFDKRTATVKAISRSRLMSIDATEIDSLVETNPSLILHITKKLADRLKSCNNVFIEAQNDVEDYMNKLAIKEGSCGAEIERILDLFMENVNLIEICSSEVKVLKKMYEAINSKHKILSERLGGLSNLKS